MALGGGRRRSPSQASVVGSSGRRLPMNWSGTLRTRTNRLPTSQPKVYHMPQWDGYGDPKRLDVIARIAESRGRDPKIATLAVQILRKAGVKPRQFKKQSAALLKWVQDNIYYVNEPGERLQDPLYTLKVGYGDCDDMTIVLYSLVRSLRLPAKLVIVGVNRNGKKVRYHQGDAHYPQGVEWSHIYMAVGDDPFNPKRYFYAEPTVQGAPLGWDVVNAKNFNIPELAGFGSPSAVTSSIAGSMAELVATESESRGSKHTLEEGLFGLHWNSIFAAALVGSIVSVTSTLLSDYLKASFKKARKRADSQESAFSLFRSID